MMPEALLIKTIGGATLAVNRHSSWYLKHARSNKWVLIIVSSFEPFGVEDNDYVAPYGSYLDVRGVLCLARIGKINEDGSTERIAYIKRKDLERINNYLKGSEDGKQ